MGQYDETLRLRLKDNELAGDDSQHGPGDVAGAPTMVVTTTTVSSYPTSPNCFFACKRDTISGSEVEGSMGMIAAATTRITYVFNLGTAIPPSGTQLVATFVPNRWVMRYDG